MKRCQPDGRSDVRTFLFPLSWVSLISKTGYLLVDVTRKLVLPHQLWPNPTVPLHSSLCTHVHASLAFLQHQILKTSAIQNEIPLKECVVMKSCWMSHCARAGKAGRGAGQILTLGTREREAEEESKLRARSTAVLGQPRGLGCKCFST